jgi:hypothetical protein
MAMPASTAPSGPTWIPCTVAGMTNIATLLAARVVQGVGAAATAEKLELLRVLGRDKFAEPWVVR